MNQACQLAHELFYGLAPGNRLSAQAHLIAWRAFATLGAGGLGMGLVNLALARFRPARPVDPIEANALYGGKMSLIDSLLVVGQTMLSNGAGASVGLEAGYTQIGAAFASKIGGAFRVRRADLRLLVGCGAAGAIASAFNAPLTGAFYAFELVIGTYTLTTLAPVVVAAISAVMVQRLILGDEPGYDVSYLADMHTVDFLPLAALAVLRRVASEPMPAALELRYLGLANTLNRSADQSEHSMERRRREPPARRVRAQPAEQPAPPPKLDPQPGRGVMDPAIAAVIHEHLAARRQTDTTQQPHDEPAPSDNPAGKQAEGQPLRYRGAAAAPVSQWQRNLMQTTTMSSVTAPGLPPLSGTPAARQP